MNVYMHVCICILWCPGPLVQVPGAGYQVPFLEVFARSWKFYFLIQISEIRSRGKSCLNVFYMIFDLFHVRYSTRHKKIAIALLRRSIDGSGFARDCADSGRIPAGFPAGFRPVSGRIPAGFRPYSDRIPAGFRLDSDRILIGFRPGRIPAGFQ